MGKSVKDIEDLEDRQYKLVGKRVKELREKRDISIRELSKRSGISESTIKKFESGDMETHRGMRFSTLRNILSSMKYSLKDMAKKI